MKSVEFCYWLQGYFELTENLTLINESQTNCIKQHLKLVAKYELEKLQANLKFTKAQSFCCDLMFELEEFNYTEISGLFLKGVKIELHNVFKHEIDHSYGNSAELDKIHGIYNTSNIVRC